MIQGTGNLLIFLFLQVYRSTVLLYWNGEDWREEEVAVGDDVPGWIVHLGEVSITERYAGLEGAGTKLQTFLLSFDPWIF